MGVGGLGDSRECISFVSESCGGSAEGYSLSGAARRPVTLMFYVVH
jgi:hypothetical protein